MFNNSYVEGGGRWERPDIGQVERGLAIAVAMLAEATWLLGKAAAHVTDDRAVVGQIAGAQAALAKLQGQMQ